MRRALKGDDRLLWGEIVQHTPDAVLVYDMVRDRRGRAAAFRLRMMNPAARRLFEDVPDGLRGLLPESATDDLFDRYASLVAGGQPMSLDKIIHGGDSGIAICWNLEARSLDDEAVLVRIADVTTRARAAVLWKREAERLALHARRSSDVLALVDVDGRIAWSSDSAERVLGRGFGDLRGRRPSDLVHPDYHAAVEALADGGKLRVRAMGPDEEPRWLELVTERREEHQLLILRDVTTVRRLESTVAELQGSGGLPGVVARAMFVQQLKKEVARRKRYGRTVSVVAFALDARTVLRKHGALDEAQLALAEVATDVLRVADVIGAWNDEVFLLLLPETPVLGAIRACERLNDGLAVRRLSALPDHPPTLSAGIVAVDFDDDVKSVLKRALEGLARHRRMGAGTVDVAAERGAA